MRLWQIALLFIATGNVTANIAQSPVAIVHSLDGKAWVKNAKDASPSLLKNNQELYAGQWISCSKGCRELIISQCKLNLPVAHVPTWKQILAVNCFSNYGTRGGRSKGEGPSIISPKESERLRYQRLSLRWLPFPPTTQLKISLKISLGEMIWGSEIIDGSKGSYRSSSLTAALKKVQAQNNQVALVFNLDDGKNPIQRVKFYIISSDDEKELNSGLTSLNSESNLILRAAGRGALFSEYELYTDAAREFERGLLLAEQQRADRQTLVELISLSIQANYLAYNDDRVKELCESSELSGLQLPRSCPSN